MENILPAHSSVGCNISKRCDQCENFGFEMFMCDFGQNCEKNKVVSKALRPDLVARRSKEYQIPVNEFLRARFVLGSIVLPVAALHYGWWFGWVTHSLLMNSSSVT